MAQLTESEVIAGVVIVEPDVHGDERGIFVETYRRHWFPGGREMIQANRGDRGAGAVVGLHYHLHQADYWYVPFGRARVVLHDLRSGSPTDGATLTVDLGSDPGTPGSQHDHRGVYIPPGVAHGFAALTDMTITYLVDGYYNPSDELGVAWDDLSIAADWGVANPTLSERDRTNPARADLPEDRQPHWGLRGVKILVTGGAGFIGSNYVRYVLAHTDDEVVVYDALTYAGNLSTLKDVDDDPRYSFVKGDICDPAPLEEAMDGVDAVVHFAAESHVDRSIIGSDDFVTTNCFGTNIVMDLARRLEIGRVVHIGTDEVYGSIESGSSTEQDGLAPRSPYSASKAGADLIALSYHHTHGLPVTVTRCTNNFGPFQYPEKAIPLFTTNLIDGGRVPLYGDGLNERDWIYVDDHCAAVHLVLHEGTPGEIYNVGAGNETPNRVLVDKLLALLGKDETSVEYVTDRLGHDRRYSVDITKITALGWSKARSLDEALAATVDWYRANEWWWRPLKAGH